MNQSNLTSQAWKDKWKSRFPKSTDVRIGNEDEPGVIVDIAFCGDVIQLKDSLEFTAWDRKLQDTIRNTWKIGPTKLHTYKFGWVIRAPDDFKATKTTHKTNGGFDSYTITGAKSGWAKDIHRPLFIETVPKKYLMVVGTATVKGEEMVKAKWIYKDEIFNQLTNTI